MRVLWFTNIPCNYTKTGGYHGGGWLSSLHDAITLACGKEIELGVSFCMDNQPHKATREGTVYYPVPSHKKSLSNKVLDLINYNDEKRDIVLWPHYINHFKRVIEDFKPDVIEVFGSELYTGLGALAAKELGIPCVLHLQGLLSLSIYILLPTGVSRRNFILKDGFKGAFANFQLLTYWKRSCYREKAILNAVNHVIGRTEWDRQALEIINPKAKYHYGGEILRPCFYEDSERHIPVKPIITTTSSVATYKGFDIILKTANILKNECNIDFTWNVYGNVEPSFYERLTRIKHNEVNVQLKGVASAEQLREAMLSSSLYFQPSYVENSPNSVAEAQMLGLPAVATNIGGTPSMISHNETGFLFSATDPYMGAYYAAKLIRERELNINIGRKSQEIATKRHDPKSIVNNLIMTYKELINDTKQSYNKSH